MAASLTALVGCSTVKDISPFTSNVPYAHDIKPTLPQPAVTEVPAFKATPKPAKPAPEEASPAKPASDEAPAAKPAPAEAAPPSPAAPAHDIPPPPPPPAETEPAAPAAPAADKQSARDVAPRTQMAEAPQAAAPPERKAESPAISGAPAGTTGGPNIPAERRAFTKDDGTYPNLAQVPSRPVNLPTFADAVSLEKSLQGGAPAKQGASTASAEPKADEAVKGTTGRPEDRTPCLDRAITAGDPTLTVRFKSGSAALTAEDLAQIVESLPTVKGGKGTIRIYGHGDTETNAPLSAERFDLAVARADAVAQALAGYGVATPRMAVGVACVDTATAGASVQLYADS